MGRVWDEHAVQKHRFTTALSVISALDESPIAAGLLVVGTDDGLLQISENGGERWKRFEKFSGVPQWTYVSDVCASQHDAERLYVSFNNHQRGDFRPYLLRSDDRGTTWTSIAANLPDRHAVWSIVEDPVSSDLLFVGTELGLFVTVNGGQKWNQLKNGAPTVAYRDLVIHKREQDLVAATFGRGFYVLDDFSALRHLSSELAGEGGVLPPRDTWVYHEIGYVEAVYGNYTTPNPPFGSTISYYLRCELPEGEGNRIALSIESTGGSIVRTLDGPATPGFHRVQWDLHRAPEREERPRRRRGGNRGGRRSGPLVEPGEYTIKLLRVVDGEESVLGEPATLKVKAIPEASFR